jgi:autotransporter-associated beta strand protein
MKWNILSRRIGSRQLGRGRSYKPCLECLEDRALLSASWLGLAHDPQHTAQAPVASQPLGNIHWQTPVDLKPQYSGGDLLIHYGSPLMTAANTVIVPVKTGASGNFELEAFDGGSGALKWTQTTDYALPPHNWTPSYGPTVTPTGRLYFAGAGGTVYYCDSPDANGATTTGQLAFYGIGNYTHAGFDSSVFINTPITADSAGNIYFGFMVTGSNPLNLTSGLARMAPDGTGSWVAASTAANDSGITKVVHNCAPALSNDQSTVYVAVSNGNGTGFGTGYLLALDSTTLATKARANLLDVKSGNKALLPDDGSASPTVGPDGDVYFGVLENPFPSNNDRGWLLHFSADLSQAKISGAFGWDDTASIVPASMVPSYAGTSKYLLMSKYNNYAGINTGNGQNKIAVLDPNATEVDPVTGATVMQEVLTILGPTPDSDHPGGVREWCINTAAVDPATDSILANSEDGTLYRWDMKTNTFTQRIVLTTGIGEAYTPTVVGPDGTVYAINRATLFAVGHTVGISTDTWSGKGPDSNWSDAQNWTSNAVPRPGDNLVFGAGASQLTSNNDFTAGTAFGSITLNSAGYTISGNPIALSGGIDASAATGNNAFNLGVTLSNAQTFAIGGNSTTVTFGGSINTNTFTLTIGGGAGAGVLSGVVSGSGGVTMTDTGIVTFAGSAPNTYSGTTAVNGGTVILNDSAGNAIVGPVTIGAGSGAQLLQLAASNQLSGTASVTVNSTGRLDLNNNSTAIGALTLSSGKITTGSGTLTLGGNVGSSGPSSISGNLSVAATRTFTVANGATLTITAAISGGGGVANAGTGTLLLSGANTYSGGTTQSSGILAVGNNSALGTGGVALNGGTMTATGGPVTLANAVTAGGNVTFAGTNNLTFTGAATLTGNRTLTVTNTGTTTFAGNIGQTGGARSLTEGGAGLFVLSGNNTFSGGASIVMGLVGVGSNTACGTGQLGVRYSTLRTMGADITLANNVMTNGDDVTFAGNQRFTFTGNWTFAYDRRIIVNNPQVLISGTIKQTSSGTKFTKDGPGVLVFAGACTYTDATIVTAGTLLVTGSIGAASGITVNSGGTLAGSGTVGAVTVKAGGTVLPGTNSTTTGILTTTGITFASGAAFDVTLNGNVAGTGYDQLSSTGAINLGGGTLNVTLGFTPAVGAAFTILQNKSGSSVNGTFNGLGEGATFAVGVETFQITYQGGSSLKDVVITRIS